MPAADSRAPVIVGAGEVTDRSGSASPLDLMVAAAGAATSDAALDSLRGVDTVAAVDCISWPAQDPGRAVAAALGLDPARTLRSIIGGNGPLVLLGELCASIQSGASELALLVGGEAFHTLMRCSRAGEPTGWPEPPADQPDGVVGDGGAPSHPAEAAAGLVAPIVYYPLFETALRAGLGTAPDAHLARIARLWERFSRAAATNPHAWAREFPDADEIADAGPENRMAAFPYRKLMTANIQVDQGAALVVCSVGKARALGIATDRMVFLEAVAAAQDRWHAGERESLARSPALAACGKSALAHAGAGIDDVAAFDIYSCFPSAVQIAGSELGFDVLDDARAPTVTGGLTFAGGPGNDYATHSLAAMTRRLREDADSRGLVTAVGWYMTKHAVAVLSSSPPDQFFAAPSPQEEVDTGPGREVAVAEPSGATVEAYTATYDRAGNANVGIVSVLLEDGRRSFANSDRSSEIEVLIGDEPLGRAVRLDGEGGFAFA